MMGMRPCDVYDLELAEFSAAHEGWLRAREMAAKEGWEQHRWSASRIASMWLPKTADAREYFSFPWDNDAALEVATKPEISIEERRERVREILSKIENR